MCDEQIAVSGEGQISPELDGDGKEVWEPYFIPRFCYPPLEICEVPEKCPDEIKTQLRAAFSLFWCDEAAAANRVRIALERLMDHVGVRSRRRQPGKIADLSLHERIDIFQSREPATGAQLMALKWLGNTGSHEGQVQREDLLDAFEILEHVLAELIERRTAKVAQLARQLSKKHGPVRKTPRRNR